VIELEGGGLLLNLNYSIKAPKLRRMSIADTPS